MRLGFSYNKIYVIESLQDDDIKTGKNLHESLIKWKVHNNPKLSCVYVEVENNFQFEELMKRINLEVKSGFFPFIHIETHGSNNKDGLVLSSGELLSWNQLAFF